MSVVVCGSFSSINNPTFDSLAMWNGTTLSKPYTASLFTYLGIPPAGVSGSYGSLLPSFINGIVKRSNGDLYISITYPSGQSSPYKGIYRWNGTAWSTIFSDENVIAIDIHTASDTIYFTTGHNSNVYKVAPSSNTPEKIGVSDAMEMSGCIAINQTTGDLYYGGQFSNMLDLNTYTPILSVENLARYSGGTWYPFGGQTVDGNQPGFPPAVGKTSVDSTTATSAVLSWGAAEDTYTDSSFLQYKVVKASSASAIDTVEEANAITGSGIVSDWN